jgi:hypothetical protein
MASDPTELYELRQKLRVKAPLRGGTISALKFPVIQKTFPVRLKKIPVLARREFDS